MEEINLRKIITEHPDCLHNAQKLKGIIADVYPRYNKGVLNVIIAILRCEIIDQIRNAAIVSESDAKRWAKKLTDNHGYDTEVSLEAIKIWHKALAADQCYQGIEGTSAGLLNPQRQQSSILFGAVQSSVSSVRQTAHVTYKTTTGKNEQHLAQAVAEMPDKKYRAGSKVKCRVVQTTEDGVYVRIDGRKTEDFIPNEELVLEGDVQEYKKSLKENDLLECKITTIGSKGNITLSKKAIDEQNMDDVLVPGIKEGNEFSVTMTRMAKNCLTGRLGSYTVVVHASQIKMGYVKDLEKYVGKTLRLKVSGPDKVNEEKHVIFASAKAIILEEKKAKEDAFWNGIEKNEIVEGEVLRFASFGAFVNVRGFDCLAHTSDLSWDRINSPEEVLEKGKTYEFVVLDTDREHNRVSLGYKQLQPKPWEQAEEKFPVGTVVTGKVARLMPYGAFIELGSHIDGLLHVSNYDWDWIEDISKVLKVGDEVEVKVMDFDAENHRITLSRKALIEKPEHVVTRPRTTEE